MLRLIANFFKGQVRISKDEKTVIWVLDNKKHIINAIKTFDKYPPLTSRLFCSLSFLKFCLKNNDVDIYLSTRNFKYSNQLNVIHSWLIKLCTPCLNEGLSNLNTIKELSLKDINSYTINKRPRLANVSELEILNLNEKGLLNPNSCRPAAKLNSYFYSWLSGFIEAEGCFSIRKNNACSFSIAQNNDIYILYLIKSYFNATNKIRKPYKDKPLYSLEIYKKLVLQNIIKHCEEYSLLGAKLDSLEKFKKFI